MSMFYIENRENTTIEGWDRVIIIINVLGIEYPHNLHSVTMSGV